MDDDKFKTNIESVDNKLAMKKYKSIERGALLRGIKFEIVYKDYIKYYQKPCYYCGIPAIGLDRIDSVIGYKLNNVVGCCGICNMMKASLDQAGFLGHCRRIAFIHFGDEDGINTSFIVNGKYGSLIPTIKEKERQMIIDVLTNEKGDRKAASSVLGISTTTLWRKMKCYKISYTNCISF